MAGFEAAPQPSKHAQCTLCRLAGASAGSTEPPAAQRACMKGRPRSTARGRGGFHTGPADGHGARWLQLRTLVCDGLHRLPLSAVTPPMQAACTHCVASQCGSQSCPAMPPRPAPHP